jgi:hypothetical protein
MPDHLDQASNPLAGTPVLGWTVHLSVLALLLVLPNHTQLFVFWASVHLVLTWHEHVLGHAICEALNKGALF